jgi:hypothetical protein
LHRTTHHLEGVGPLSIEFDLENIRVFVIILTQGVDELDIIGVAGTRKRAKFGSWDLRKRDGRIGKGGIRKTEEGVIILVGGLADLAVQRTEKQNTLHVGNRF